MDINHGTLIRKIIRDVNNITYIMIIIDKTIRNYIIGIQYTAITGAN